MQIPTQNKAKVSKEGVSDTSQLKTGQQFSYCRENFNVIVRDKKTGSDYKTRNPVLGQDEGCIKELPKQEGPGSKPIPGQGLFQDLMLSDTQRPQWSPK